MRLVKLMIILSLVAWLSGCVEPTRVEEAGIINTRGIDIGEEDGQRVIEISIMPLIFDQHSEETTTVINGRGKTVKEAREDAGYKVSSHLTPGKIVVDIYSKEAAKAGLLPLLNTLVRDARVSDTMQLIISNQTARELLETEQENIKLDKLEYFHDIVKKEVDADILPRNTLEYFTRYIERVGTDPILPVMDLVDGRPSLIAGGVFQNDQYVGEITLEETFLVEQMRRRVSRSPLRADIPAVNYLQEITSDEELTGSKEQISLSLQLRSGRGQIEIESLEELAFRGNIWMKVKLLETSVPMDIGSPEIIGKIERDLRTYYEEKYENLFQKVQELGSDVFWLGRQYTATREGSGTSIEEWRKKYADATIEFNVDVTVMHYGTID